MSQEYFYGRRWSIFINEKPFIDSGVDQLRCKFEVTHEFGGVISYIKISIYNLSKDTIEANLKSGNSISLNAGYINNIDEIATGVIINTYKSREGADTVINLICTTTYIAPKKIKPLKQTLQKNSSIHSIAQYIANQTGFKLKMKKEEFAKDPLIKKSITLFGNPIDILKNLSITYEFDFCFLNKTLLIVKKIKSFTFTDTSSIQTLSMETGMEDIPEFTDVGYNVKSRLNPKYKIGQLLKIKSNLKSLNYGAMHFRNIPSTDGEGVYRIQKITINGDTHGEVWTSKLYGFIERSKEQ